MLGFPNFERHYLSYIYFILVVVAIYGVASDQVSIQLTFNEQLFLFESVLHVQFYVLTVWVCNFLAEEYWYKSCS